MDFFDSKFPGNLSVAEKLYAAIDNDGVVAFTGAGTSMPEMPPWNTLVDNLVRDAKRAGVMDPALADSLLQGQVDPLYCIDEVYVAAGESQTKGKIAQTFKSLKSPTECHNLLISTKIKKFITLNYDLGLEAAESEIFHNYLPSVTFKSSAEFQAWASSASGGENIPVMHWHGVATDADSIVLSEKDYSKLYNDRNEAREILRGLFSRERCLLVGFGFTDAFIVSHLSAVMSLMPSLNRHFAIIGVAPSPAFNCSLERRKFQSKYKAEVMFYPIYDGEEDPHRDLRAILQELQKSRPRNVKVGGEKNSENADAKSSEAMEPRIEQASFRAGLFQIDGREIYCEPNLKLNTSGSITGISTSTIAASKSGTRITCSSGPNSSISGRSCISVASRIAGDRKGSFSSRRFICMIGEPPRLISARKLSDNRSAVPLSITQPM